MLREELENLRGGGGGGDGDGSGRTPTMSTPLSPGIAARKQALEQSRANVRARALANMGK